MASFVLMSVLRHARDIPAFEKAQREKRWNYVHPRLLSDIKVGVLGLGELGSAAVLELSLQGFDVRGWSRSQKRLPGIDCRSGLEALPQFLSECEILVVMLPLTPERYHLLNAERLALLPKGAKFVNVARGPIVDEPALIAALQSGAISEATLDVFEHEPLPQGQPAVDHGERAHHAASGLGGHSAHGGGAGGAEHHAGALRRAGAEPGRSPPGLLSPARTARPRRRRAGEEGREHLHRRPQRLAAEGKPHHPRRRQRLGQRDHRHCEPS